MAIVGAGIGAAMRHAPGRRIMVRGLPDPLARADRQPGREAPLPCRAAADRTLTIRTQVAPAGRRARSTRSSSRRGRTRAGLEVVYPSTPEDVRGCSGRRSTTTIRSSSSAPPALSGEGRRARRESSRSRSQSKTVREGRDVTVIAIGPLVHRALDAAKQAEEEGISVEVIDPRTLQPLDEDRSSRP